MSFLFRPAAFAASLAFLTAPALAQQGPGWFVPPAGGPAGGQSRPPSTRPQVAPRPQAAPMMPPAMTQPPPQVEAELPPSPPPPLPPVPDLPALARANAPPASVIGVLSIPDIMRASLAAQEIEKIITERREKLNVDAQKEQAAWRDLQQQLANQRATLNADQIRAKERELQERITNAQKQFRDRNRIIQEAGQYGLAQIEQVLVGVIRQVAESRGMNLVLHRAQIVLNVAEFDMTEQVSGQLNKVLATVVLPPDGVSPSVFAPSVAGTSAPGATPVSAPGASTPTPPPAPAPAPAVAAPRR